MRRLSARNTPDPTGPGTHNPSVRALGRLRWLLLALGIPACIAAAGVVLQAAAFGRAPKDTLVATNALRELVRYHVMRGDESFAGKDLTTTCIQGWFRAPRSSRLLPGALVLLGNGERLYDLGTGIRVFPKDGPTRPADLAERTRFVLAGCPRFLGNRFAFDLIRGRAVEASSGRADGEAASTIAVGGSDARLTLDVTPITDKPLELLYSDGRYHGASDLVPGGGASAIRRVRRAFDLTRRAGQHNA